MRSFSPLLLLVSFALVAAACGGSDTADATGDSETPEVASETTAAAVESTTTEAEPVSETDGAETAPVTITGEPLAGIEGGGIIDTLQLDPANGTIAPTLEGTNFQGEAVTIGPDGRAKAVYFLAHWCPHCQDEVKLLKQLIEAGDKPDDVDIYGVTIAVRDDADNYPPSAWMADFPGTVMRDTIENEAAIASGVSGIPYVLYLDGENRLISRSIGSLTEDQVLSQWRSLLPQSS